MSWQIQCEDSSQHFIAFSTQYDILGFEDGEEFQGWTF